MMGWIKLRENRVGFRKGWLPVLVVWVLLASLMIPQQAVGQTEIQAEWVASVVSLQGQVQVRRQEAQHWQTVRLDDRFLAGDVIKVGANSRAAFVLKNESTLRVDQKTTLVFSAAEPQQPFLIELIYGAVHFFSRVHRSLRIVTPFVNGAVEGTEFVAQVSADRAVISLLEGRLRVFNPQGSILMTQNQSVSAAANQPPLLMAEVKPKDAVHWTLYYPAVIDFKPEDFGCGQDWCAAARQSVGAWRRGDLLKAFDAMEAFPEIIDDPRLLLFRAALRLSVGRVDAARVDLHQVQSSESQRSDALALLAIAAVVQNKKEEARRLIDQANAQPPVSSGVDMANGYVQQAFFDLDGALDSVRSAAQKDPGNALAWARLSELYLAKGERTQALNAAQRAADLQPDLAHAMTVLGFARLAQIKSEKAKQAFAKAISVDSAAPMARLGMGLAKIREGQLDEGRGEIEIAACLDPGNALIRSYLGKAYYEEKRDDPASVQLAAAKQLDPADPTPWFYDAIRKQSINRPVEALEDLQQSMARNDNRAVYRSRFLMDEDLAARSAGLARIYSDLGFQQLALVEGWKSLNTDPGNFSAHRFLSDSYSVLPRHEIARVSELLQSQLLQPININPVGPNQAESNLGIYQGTGPISPSYNEFNSLFERNRFALQLNGVAGENQTLGDEVVLSGVHNNLSFSIGQFHQQADGYRENNDLKQNIYNAYVQAILTTKASIQAEARWNDRDSGDLRLLFDQQQFQPNLRKNDDVGRFRLGGHYSFSPSAEMIASFIYNQSDEEQTNTPLYFVHRNIDEQAEGYNAELQYLLRKTSFNVITGAGYMDGDLDEKRSTHYDSDRWYEFIGGVLPPGTPLPPPPSDEQTEITSDMHHGNAYVYSHFQVLEGLNLTGGLSYDDFDNELVDVNQFNPKLGMTWRPFSRTTFRWAVFRVLTRTLLNDQTVEPTQVAGFNQFYRDIPGADIWTYGAAVDQKVTSDVYGGIEYFLRDLEIPYEVELLGQTQVQDTNWEERIGRGYLYWAPHPWIVGTTEYILEDWDRGSELGGREAIRTLTTHRFGLGANFFHPNGIFARLKATYTDQEGEFWNEGLMSTRNESDNFWVFDAAVGFRFPNRYGMFTLEVKNLFDEEIKFQDTDPANPTIYPERLALVRLTLSF
jgi:tetratricopeptide (TPR) repeat protein